MPVSLTVTPNVIQDVAPAGAAMSLILPQNTPDIRAAFCCHVHFFASDAVCHDWASRHATADIVNVHDAFAVGRECAERLLRARVCQTQGAQTPRNSGMQRAAFSGARTTPYS
ncbi:organomercurial lyase [Paraburkholderia sp. SIMBA_054]|uniref:organomercurial lyase n=1 Tax=Paraburkholderia sp. SIMBA_054 TaxID=3085795 RepID=UPI0039792DD5